ncbi:hypothetical protein EGI26_05220 [Lacihabitans sp. CCS-44]|uniref:hypothetical protein n=1 Tax=Lacihabitans sp. CCS-44 TaxID=2487331 RepID=UPI0020CEC49A|nr:hypothetical protein [Lacihabitans sp. CCS-44]MCP9754564.1 hypothetical protein [Lacihabitans sp. CCS-44]
MEGFEIFDDYLNNKMTFEARLGFEQQLLENPELKSSFNDYKVVLELLRFQGLKSDVEKANKAYQIRNESKFSFPKIKIAAIIIFGLLTFSAFWTNLIEGADLLENVPIEYIEPNQRGDAEEKPRAEFLYLTKDYEGLIKLYVSSNEPTEKLEFLTAMAYFNKKEYNKVLELIEKLEPRDKTNVYKNEIEFYKCQSLIGLNKYSEAEGMIQKMEYTNPYKSTFDWIYVTKIKILAWKESFF